MTSSLINATTTADAVAAVLDADRLSELLQRPVRAARLRIKPEVSVLVSLTDRSTGLTAGWARLLWPVSHSKAAQAERLAASQLPSTPSSVAWARGSASLGSVRTAPHCSSRPSSRDRVTGGCNPREAARRSA